MATRASVSARARFARVSVLGPPEQVRFLTRFSAPADVFIYDFEGPCVAHGKRADFVNLTLQGILDKVNNTAVNGTWLHEQFVAKANLGGGWMPYMWKNSAEDTEIPKIAYLFKINK